MGSHDFRLSTLTPSVLRKALMLERTPSHVQCLEKPLRTWFTLPFSPVIDLYPITLQAGILDAAWWLQAFRTWNLRGQQTSAHLPEQTQTLTSYALTREISYGSRHNEHWHSSILLLVRTLCPLGHLSLRSTSQLVKRIVNFFLGFSDFFGHL